MGGVQNCYLTNIRNNIFTMKHSKDSFILNTGDWHFNTTVYSNKQNIKKDLNIDSNHINKTQKYNEILLNSRFSLCPSGSGPNSIRFWESLACGSIPVLLSDTLDLPYDCEWENAIVIIKECNYNNINSILSKITKEKEEIMRSNCLLIYNKLKNNFKNELCNYIDFNKKNLFTSYLCDINDPIIQKILLPWKLLNKHMNVLYFSDKDIDDFFKNTEYYDTYKKMKNGVAIADFFRICYINKNGGYWFDIDINPFKVNIPKIGNIHLYDCGFKNISYMFIGGNKNQKLFCDVIDQVVTNINNNIPIKKQHVMYITGPRIIQNLILNKLSLENVDGALPASEKETVYLKNTDYEFIYSLNITSSKTNDYKLLQTKYNKKPYQQYNFI